MRCWTILLACGWLLLVPPEGPKRPLSEWKHEMSFDKALNCERFKSALGNDAAKFSKDNPNDLHARAVKDRYARARCVPIELIDFKLK